MKPKTAIGTAIEIETRYICRFYRYPCKFYEAEGRRNWCCHEHCGLCHNKAAIEAAEKAEKEQA